MTYTSINPYNLQFLKQYPEISNSQLDKKLGYASDAYKKKWSVLSLEERLEIIRKSSEGLAGNIIYHASLIAIEMGKPIKEAMAEIEKCIRVCEYYIENAKVLLKDESYTDKTHTSFVWFEPTGIIFAVMPWNFPYWQVFRFLVPNLILGNAALLKHASNVPQCAEAIEKLFLDAGLPEGTFQNLFISHAQAKQVIEYRDVTGVTLTGSEIAGSSIAELAGKNIKKTVLELGGSDPFIVLEDADIENAVSTGVAARMRNAGQSCIAAKRFILHRKIYDDFISGFRKIADSLVLGDPLSENTEMGPMAKDFLVADIEKQVGLSLIMGAKILSGGKRSSAGKLFYEPTLVEGIKEGMPLYQQEVFGPVASFFCYDKIEEAINLANNSDFGLGASIWSKDTEKAGFWARKVQSGIIAINALVASEPFIPFGGIKKSGYGRELSAIGLKEFANVKTVSIKK